MTPGGLRAKHRVKFQRRAASADAYGNTVDAWQDYSTVWCGVDTRPRGRGEAVEAGRLESALMWRVTILRSSLASVIGPDYRGVFTVGPHTGRTFNIRAVETSPDNREIWLDVETGRADG